MNPDLYSMVTWDEVSERLNLEGDDEPNHRGVRSPYPIEKALENISIEKTTKSRWHPNNLI